MQLVHISIKLILKPTAFKNHDGIGMPIPCEFLLKVSSALKYLADSGDFWDSSDFENFSRVFHRHLLNSNTRWLCKRDGTGTCSHIRYEHCLGNDAAKTLMTNTCVVLPTLPELSLPAWSCQKLGAISALCVSWDSLVPSAEVLQADSRQSLNLFCFFFRHLWGWASQAVPDSQSWLTLLLSDNGLPDFGDVINKRTPSLEITDRRNGHTGFVYLSCFFQTFALGSLKRPSSSLVQSST